ncbi:carbamoyl-phosphate synthase (glutamine-hydrolyzing) large subunit [Virgibacillus pantothenticus]|uniref:carbamoyl-phosphate synthase (glutamine-hydrolyzing) large subunit n=1 Tax=Virgibacillus pantothenticus TaxID=1473 RepID=UPI0025B1A301|nr:carbamoyl-phosphate synthase (glutamine-hydrolyzing) large subunit [Virgibacillus pantothenticus]
MVMRKSLNKVLVIGSGPIVIGQAAEFDYAGTQACLALKEEGIEVILVNNNPATIMTDKAIADRVYLEAITVNNLEKIIAKERPDGLIGTLGGQTGLNITIALHDKGILARYHVKVLGTEVESIQKGESREAFRQLMLDMNEPVSQSKVVEDIQTGISFAKEIGFPVILRPAYTLGGEGGGFAYNETELIKRLENALKLSPIRQVLVEKSIKGWKEIEYEVIRDANDTCVIVCNMENMDPVGVHTGDSIVTAPSQTLTDTQYQMLRVASLKVIRALKVVGGCNIQFALDPTSNNYCIIEVNPRVSRSSALASKATGYPIARVATKCALGYRLDEIVNPITDTTSVAFEPALDYVVVKLPRFPFDKFTEADRTLGTQMKATGEVMAIDRTFEGALNKAVRSLEMNVDGLHLPRFTNISDVALREWIEEPNDVRLFALAEAINRDWSLEELHLITQIDPWFLAKMERILALEKQLAAYTIFNIPKSLLLQAKRFNLGDKQIARIIGAKPNELRDKYKQLQIKPAYKLVDTCAGEFAAATPYYYSTWHGQDEVRVNQGKRKVLILGSGPIRIGQGVEFDYCSVHAALAVKQLGYEAIVVNNNPETVSTDYSVADKLYFEPLALEDILQIIAKEKAAGVLIQFGGQTAVNLVTELEQEGIHVYGTTPKHIAQMEEREQFYQLLDEGSIPHMKGYMVQHSGQLDEASEQLGFPVLIRPSYVIGGQSMFIAYDQEELENYVMRIQTDRNDYCWPLLIDSYLSGKECEVDVISDGERVLIPGILEHIEKAGVHSGDSLAIFPPITLSDTEKQQIVSIATKIAQSVPIVGVMNIQFILYHEEVYVLEVNPRASRTVPIMSKMTDLPMVKWAVQVQLGYALEEITTEMNLCQEPPFFTVKAPVFSAGKLKGVDHVLGPEMKSTGEVIAISYQQEEVLTKIAAFLFDQTKAYKNLTMLVSIADRMKTSSLKTIQSASEAGISLLATKGTARFLNANGISVKHVIHNRDELTDTLEPYPPDMILNLPEQGRNVNSFGFHLREWAVRYQVPCFTSLETFEAIVLKTISACDSLPMLALQDYHTTLFKTNVTN